MIKPNKIKPTKTYSNLTFNHKGITLVALIITIIIMLILVGVTINIAINGGLFDTAKQAVKQTEIEAYREKIDAIRINLLPKQLAEGLEGKEYIDIFEEEIRKDSNFKESTITRKDELTLKVITKEGYEFEITEEETKYIGKGEIEKPEETKPEDLNEANTKFTYTPEGWTNGKVKVGIETETKGNTLEYSLDERNWKNYTGEIEIEENTAIYARLKDSKGNVGGMATGNVTKIDTAMPEITTALRLKGTTMTSINLSIGVTDTLSGFSKIEWYYKKSEDPETKYAENKKTEEDVTMKGNIAGDKGEVEKKTTIEGLTEGTYNIYAVVYDVAGNSRTSSTIDVTIEANWKNDTQGTYYSMLEEAFSTANSEDKITLLKSYTDSSTPNLNKSIIMNIGTYTLTKTESTITISNEGKLYIGGTGTITTDENMNLITNNGIMYTYERNYVNNIEVPPTNFTGTLSNTNTEGGYVVYNTGTVYTGNAGASSYIIVGNYRGIYNSGQYTLASNTVMATDYAIYNVGTFGLVSNVNSMSGCTPIVSSNNSYALYNTSTGIVTYNAGKLTSSNSYALYNAEGGTVNSNPVRCELHGEISPYYRGTITIPEGYEIITDDTNKFSKIKKVS